VKVPKVKYNILQAVGLASIPWIITPIDEGVERFADLTYKPILKKFFPVE
jgi:hypothetical protein